MKNADFLQSKLSDKTIVRDDLDMKLKYKKQFYSPDQLKVFRKRRAELNKEIHELKIKIELYG